MNMDIKTLILNIFIAIIYTLYATNSSIFGGRLSLPVTYDDMAYLNDGLNRLNTLYTEGLFRFLADFWKNTPHSPYSTMAATLAFATFGIHDWAPYLTNAVCVLLILLLPHYVVGDELDLKGKFVIGGLLLCLPLTYHSVVNFRPDMFCGLVATLGCAFLIKPICNGVIAKNDLIKAGICFALAVFAKPTVAPSVISGYAAGTLCLLYFIKTKKVEAYAGYKSILWLWVPVISVIGIFILKNISHYIEYVGHSFGGVASIWTLPRSSMFTYYFTGHGGDMFGKQIFLILGIFLISSIIFYMKNSNERKNNVIRYVMAVFVGVFIPLLVVAVDNPFLGVFFQGVFLLLVVFVGVSSHKLIAARVKSSGWIIYFLLIFPAMALPLQDVGSKFSEAHAERRDLFNEIFEEIRVPPNSNIAFATTGQIVNCGAMAWALSKIGQKRDIWCDVYALSSTSTINALMKSNVIVTAEKGALDQYTEPFQYAKTIDQVNSWLAENKRLYLAKEIPTRSGSYYVYRKLKPVLKPFDGVSFISGFKEIEGPYPQWDLGKVVWSIGGNVKIDFSCKAGDKLIIGAKLNSGSDQISVTTKGFIQNSFVDEDFRKIEISLKGCDSSYQEFQISVNDSSKSILFDEIAIRH